MASQKSINELAEDWLSLDQNPDTRKEIEDLIAGSNVAELERRLRKRIQFGTAGLRAKLQAGFSRMNDLTVLQASQGLAVYVAHTVPDALERGIVIGHDHRHHSCDFARLTACAFITKGFKVHYFDRLVHTPLVPFGVQTLGAACGVMITASHNPGPDNGYKVYWSNGCQIIPPHDIGIAASIEQNLAPWVWDKDLVNISPLVNRPLECVADQYYKVLGNLVEGTPFNPAMRFMYTPMHGVGLPYAIRAAALIGAKPHVNMFTVAEQANPDPDFPTVQFPNPEEHGALDLAMKTSDGLGISLVLASDPDADRFSAAVKGADGKWMQLTGNELGILFAYFIFQTELDKSRIAMLNSTASSQILRSFADIEGFYYEETLTGFKWLGNRALELEKQGYKVPFAFEEAIGYMFHGLHDKDGIGAMLMFIKLLCWIEETISGSSMTRAQGIILCLEEIYSKYGYFEDKNSYYVSLDPAVTASVFQSIRTMNPSVTGEYRYPETVGNRNVTYWRDLTVGYDSSTPDHVPLLPVSKGSEMITCILDNSVRVTIRGSGTEPKLKVYVEAKSTSREKSKQLAEEVWDDLDREWFKPRETGLLRP
ncbi:hypothetical protein POJ06DRAFT_79826 [Lipomyces tetrasporus]|uniref:Phosphoglucomutase n=1 Tax=Lipomyces tetrasporus TaxID=54092 RepID=A0AAD7QWK7_9ASCO|nr:uncharacterized protein POJ06DRAFT_79826 [Lipomyces tetrasporus]KAJ8102231.1 hypothetical protein POJ06DRAFT_79826 [Lipomyces tetrasporus]